MKRRNRNPWGRLTWDAWMLGAEAGQVIALRTAKIAAGGPDAPAEAKRMVAEKVDALAAWQGLALTGALGFSPPGVTGKTLKHYRRRVRANRRRLTRSS